jgi:putative lipoprotein
MPPLKLRAALAATLVFASFAVARPAHADEWWAPDKALHFGVSAGLGAGGYAASALIWDEPWQRALAGATVSLSAGVAKEVWDASGHGDPSWKDLCWDGIGTAVGVGLATAIDIWLIKDKNEPAPRRAALSIRW